MVSGRLIAIFSWNILTFPLYLHCMTQTSRLQPILMSLFCPNRKTFVLFHSRDSYASFMLLMTNNFRIPTLHLYLSCLFRFFLSRFYLFERQHKSETLLSIVYAFIYVSTTVLFICSLTEKFQRFQRRLEVA